MRWLVGLAALLAAGASAGTLAARDPEEHFRPEELAWSAPRAPTADLAAVAADTLRALREMKTPPAPGYPAAFAGPAEATLDWLVRVAAADAAAEADRLADPAFLSRCLATWRWVPTIPRAGEELRLTRYLVYDVEGRATPDAAFTHALWSLPHDEAGLGAEEAEARRGSLDRFRYTRQDVSAGVYREGGAAAGRADPLVWLSHRNHEGAILQGTIAVTLPGEAAPRLYNVHRHNGFPYDRGVRDTRQQRRYWYFRAIDAVRGWAREPVAGPALRPWVSVAGGLDALGFGRVIALRTADGLRLVVLADTGGAFEGNLSQLDLYTGFHPSRAAFDAATSHVGDYAAAWIVAPRKDTPGCNPDG